MTRHVDAEVLGRFSAGDLSRSRAARIGAHLRSCGRCAELSRQLAGITALLASVPAPAMPEHLATRISSSLATEAARRSAREAAASTGPADLAGAVPSADETSRTGRIRAGRSHRAGPADRAGWRALRPRLGSSPVALRVLAAAGAVAVLAGGGYAILRTTAAPTSGPAAPASGALTGPGSNNGARSAASAVGGLTVGPALTYRADTGPAGFRPVASAANYTPDQLTAQVSNTLARVGRKLPTAAPEARQSSAGVPPEPAPAGTARFGGVLVTVIEGCVSRVAAGQQVLLVEIAHYRGEPATVIVVRPAAPAADHLWVVGPACSGSASDVLAQADLPR